MPNYKLDPKTGDFSSDVYLQVTREYKCECGKDLVIQMEWPEGLTANGEINVKNNKCTQCGAPVKLPKASYYVENHRLLSKPHP